MNIDKCVYMQLDRQYFQRFISILNYWDICFDLWLLIYDDDVFVSNVFLFLSGKDCQKSWWKPSGEIQYKGTCAYSQAA